MQPRKHNRYPLSFPVKFTWEDTKGAYQLGSGLSRDISRAGAYVYATSCPPIGASVRLEFLLPPIRRGAVPLQLQGRGRVLRVEAKMADQINGFAVFTKRFEVDVRQETTHGAN